MMISLLDYVDALAGSDVMAARAIHAAVGKLAREDFALARRVSAAGTPGVSDLAAITVCLDAMRSADGPLDPYADNHLRDERDQLEMQIERAIDLIERVGVRLGFPAAARAWTDAPVVYLRLVSSSHERPTTV